MDHILIYKKGVSLKSKFADRMLAITEKYALYFCTSHDQIIHQINIEKASMMMYFVDEVKGEDSEFLRKIALHRNDLYIVLFSEAQYALDGWKMDMFHFDDNPIDFDKIKRAYAKYIHAKNPGNKYSLSIKQSEGTFNVPFHEIKYLHASGNYTFIHYAEKQNFLITKQIGQFDFLCEKDTSFQRVHRSLILNIKNIKAIKDQSIYFFNGEKPLEVSMTLIAKIKKMMKS